MCCGQMSLAKLCGKRSKSIPLETEDSEKRSDCRIEELAEKPKQLDDRLVLERLNGPDTSHNVRYPISTSLSRRYLG